MKNLLIILLASIASLSTYLGYQYYYMQTLKLSQVVGHTNNTQRHNMQYLTYLSNF